MDFVYFPLMLDLGRWEGFLFELGRIYQGNLLRNAPLVSKCFNACCETRERGGAFSQNYLAFSISQDLRITDAAKQEGHFLKKFP